MVRYYSYPAVLLVILALNGCRISGSPLGSNVSIYNSVLNEGAIACTEGLQVIATVKGVSVESPLVPFNESWESPSLLDAFGLPYELEAVCYTESEEYIGAVRSVVPHESAWMGVIVRPPGDAPAGNCAQAEGTPIYPCFLGVY